MSGPAAETFSTIGLPVPQRIALWERHNAAALVGLEVRAGTALQAAETSVRLPAATLARVRGSAHAVHRSAAAISRDPCAALAVYLPLRGEGSFEQDGRALTLRPGHALVCETDRPFTRTFAHGLEELVVTVPHAALDLAYGRAPDAPLLPRPSVTAFGAAAAGTATAPGPAVYAAALARLAARATRDRQPVRADARTIVELVCVLADGEGGARSDRARAYRAAARAFIEDHVGEPGLGADRVAHAVGISERHLSRIFAADGTSVPRYVLARRLELAYALLAAPPTRTALSDDGSARCAESVGEIASACGFTSTAYFSHVFARRFGRHAGELLREARAERRRLLISAIRPPEHGGVPSPR